MLLHKKERKLKEALAMQREHNELHALKRAIKQVELDEPIFKGYKKFFVLREDIALRDDAQLIRDVLRKVNNTIYAPTVAFKYKSKNKWMEMPHVLKPIFQTLYGFNKEEHLKWLDEHKQYLTGGWLPCFESGCKEHQLKHFHAKHPWWFEPKIEKHFLTHYTPVDPELESRLAQLNNELYVRNGYAVIQHAHGHKSSWDDDRRRDLLGAELLKAELENQG